MVKKEYLVGSQGKEVRVNVRRYGLGYGFWRVVICRILGFDID